MNSGQTSNSFEKLGTYVRPTTVFPMDPFYGNNNENQALPNERQLKLAPFNELILQLEQMQFPTVLAPEDEVTQTSGSLEVKLKHGFVIKNQEWLDRIRAMGQSLIDLADAHENF